MKIKRVRHFHAEVATSSLNDIMFFLLLFFLIVSTVTNPNVIKILLPKSSATQTINKQPVTLTVTPDKRYYVNKKEFKIAQLEQVLLAATEDMPEPTVVLRIPYSLSIQDLVDVMQIGTRHKLKMVLSTTKSN